MGKSVAGKILRRGIGGEFGKLAANVTNGRFAVFGHHTGAAIAVQMAFDAPGSVADLALSGPPFLTDAQRSALVACVRSIEQDRVGAHLAALWQRIAAKDGEAPLASPKREYAGAVLLGDRYRAAYAAVAAHPFAEQLVKLDCPILLMAGSNDSLRACLEPASEARPDAQVSEIAGGTTCACESHAPELATILRDFLLRSDPRESPYGG